MHKDNYHIAVTDGKKSVLLHCLNELRTKQLESSKDSTPVDEVLLKIINAKKKKFKIIEREV